MGLQTLFRLRRQGFFIPYRYADQLPERQAIYAGLEDIFAASQSAFGDLLRKADSYAADLLRIADEPAPPPAPRYTQSWFPSLDAVAAYTLVREYRPQRIVEIGSGHSTRFLARAVADGQLETKVTAIDPAPRAAITGLSVGFVPQVVQDCGLALFAELQAGDILFIDSSHILMPGTDVDWLFNRILPQLPAGLLIHIHDIFLPDDYPADWSWRGYNEQQAIGPMLLGGFRLLFASHWAVTRMREAVQQSVVGRLPSAAEAVPASLWLIKQT